MSPSAHAVDQHGLEQLAELGHPVGVRREIDAQHGAEHRRNYGAVELRCGGGPPLGKTELQQVDERSLANLRRVASSGAGVLSELS